jgi:cytochrome c oxidase subunit 2
VGPALWHKFGTKEHIDGMDDVQVDENYVRESILNPNAKIVKGFPKGVMPTFQGQLSETELNALIEYIKTLKE